MTGERKVNLSDWLPRYTYAKGLPSLFGRDIRKSARGDCGSFAWTVLLILEGGFWGAVKAQAAGKVSDFLSAIQYWENKQSRAILGG